MTRGALSDDSTGTSPWFAEFDPGEIDGDTYTFERPIRTILAPNVALADDLFYALKFRCASVPPDLPGSTIEEGGWQTIGFGPGAGPENVQIVEIDKAGSTPGKWLVFP